MSLSKEAGSNRTHTWSSNPELEMSMALDMKLLMDHEWPGEERCSSWYHRALDSVHEKHCVNKNCKMAKFANLEDYLNKPLPIEDYLDKPLPPTPNQPSIDLWCATSKDGEIVWEAADAGTQDAVKTVYDQARRHSPNGMSVQSSNGDVELKLRPVEDKVPTYQSLRNLRDSEELPNIDLHGPRESLTEQPTPKKRAVLLPKSPKTKLRSSEVVFCDKPVVPYGSQNPAKYVTSSVDMFEVYVVKTVKKKRKACEPIDTKSFVGFSESNVFACSPVPFKKLRVERQDDMDVAVDPATASMDLLPPLAPVSAQTPVFQAMCPLLPIIASGSPSAASTDEYLSIPFAVESGPDIPEVPTILPGQAYSAANIPPLALAPVQGYFDVVKTEPLSPVRLPELPTATPELLSPAGTEDSGTIKAEPISPGTVYPDSPRESELARLRGWPGQFESYEVGHINRRAAAANPPEIQTFGNPDHPNGEFTHVNFFVDPIEHKDYTQEHLKSVRVRKVAFSHADYETDNALEMETRNAAEEALRRQAFRECAAARLEGVSVGHHRYYEGNMAIAQYMKHKMCICWDDCWCHKLCTIYADVVCPCHRFIRMDGGSARASDNMEEYDDETALAIWEENNVRV